MPPASVAPAAPSAIFLAPLVPPRPQPPGGMCQYTVRLSAVGEIDAELMAWVRAAYDAAA